MKRHANKWLIIIICIQAIIGWSQQKSIDFIITKNGEKITGDIGIPLGDKNPRSINFRKSSQEGFTKLRPADISGFFKGGTHYQSAIVNVDTSYYKLDQLTPDKDPEYRSNTVYLKILAKGKKSLFQLTDQDGKTHFYIENNGIIPLVRRQYIIWYYRLENYEKRLAENSMYKGQLKAYLSDCKHIGKKLDKMLYLKGDFKKIFQEYYKCTNAPYEIL
jgi:hypothetical protein